MGRDLMERAGNRRDQGDDSLTVLSRRVPWHRGPRGPFTMSFGRNPYVSKAEAEEQKALCAKDATARAQAFREAGRQWERAAERETDAARCTDYTQRAEIARESADRA